jgi:hypothetical protein
MTDVLEFKRNTGSSCGLSFMRSDGETLSFKHTSEGRVELEPVIHSDLTPEDGVKSQYKIRDWTNQELANLFRVKHLLDAAGVICEIDRGLTDEGEPWFVFCQSDGEVFIHLCRIDGKYILDNPNIERPLSGYDFTDLISDFTNLRTLSAEQSTTQSNDATHRVVHLKRGGKVRLHPSALLAALVWTLYLSAEELVLVQPELDTNDIDEDHDLTITFDQSQEDQIEALAIETRQAIDEISDFDHKGLQDDFLRLEGTVLPSKDMQLSTLTAISPIGYAFGLSSIAIALGFLSEERFSDDHSAILTLIDKAFSSFGQVSELSTRSSDENSENTTRLDSIIRFLTELQLHHPLEAIAHDEPSKDAHTNTSAHQSALSDFLLQDDGFVSAEQSDQSAQKYTEDTHKLTLDTTTDEIIQSNPDAAGEQNVALASRDEKIHISTKAEDITTLIQIWDAPLHTVYLGDEYIHASFDVSSITSSEITQIFTTPDIHDEQPGLLSVDGASLATVDYFESHSSRAIEVGVTFQDVIQNVFNFDHSKSSSFDRQAKDFVKSFMAKDEDIEIIVRGDDMILIDMAGFYKSTDDDAPYYIMSWELNGGGTIATVGLQPDFDYFTTVA